LVDAVCDNGVKHPQLVIRRQVTYSRVEAFVKYKTVSHSSGE
jgi:hypothetical protein